MTLKKKREGSVKLHQVLLNFPGVACGLLLSPREKCPEALAAIGIVFNPNESNHN